MTNFDFEINRKQTNSFKWDYMKLLYGRDDLIPMWVADMDFQAPKEVIERLVERSKHGVYGYTGVSQELKNHLKAWLFKRHNWQLGEEPFVFTPGVVPALSIAILAFTNPNDKIIVQTPVYYPFFSIIEKNGRVIIRNPLKERDNYYQMDFENLLSQIDERTKMIFLCNPHNPVGRVWKREELIALGKICLERNIMIVSDEIHSDVIYKGHKHIPIATLSKELEAITITAMAPSKTFNIAGLGLSFVVIPNPELKKRYFYQVEALGLKACNLYGLEGMEAAYSMGEYWLEELLLYAEKNIDFALQFLTDHLPQITVCKPEGSYLLWLNFKNTGLSHHEIKDRLISVAGVALNEGTQFGENGERYFRLNLACPHSQLKSALEQIHKAFKN